MEVAYDKNYPEAAIVVDNDSKGKFIFAIGIDSFLILLGIVCRRFSH
ncbi:hypothetical protein AGMMS49543_15900 [Betaproteobacteria bacterium]|nr:hypothetical protein AGMMS49543_15900 [Betaproteobacteria bacterium]GHU19318.1 hypothetical protein AGMMS50243_11050 [Betaproteobacteria bacterium]